MDNKSGEVDAAAQVNADIIGWYQQKLSDSQLAQATLNANLRHMVNEVTDRDRIIAELRAEKPEATSSNEQ